MAGVSVYVFHTDAEGRYAKDISGNEAELNPRLHGALRTDAQGRYGYETIRPGSYDNNPAHVHYVVVAPRYKPRLLDLWFEDDPILVARRERRRAGSPAGYSQFSHLQSGTGRRRYPASDARRERNLEDHARYPDGEAIARTAGENGA